MMCVVQERQLLLSYFSELFPVECCRFNFVFASYPENPLVFYHDASQLCRTHLHDVSCTKMTALTYILSELFPLDAFRCNIMSAL